MAACLAVLGSVPLAFGDEPAAANKLSDANALLKRERLAHAAQGYLQTRRAERERQKRRFWMGGSFLEDDFQTDSFATGGLFRAARLPIGQPAATTATSGTLTATTTAYNYSAAPWVITAGDGTYPDLGGTATFNPILGLTAGTAATNSLITIDMSPTLSGIVANSPFLYQLGSGSSTSIIAASSGLTINSQLTAQNVVTSTSVASIPTGFAITSPISGGGTAGLTKIGTGNFYLGGTNTYTGGTHVNGGLLTIVNGDGALGTTGTGNGISINGGAILFSTTATTATAYTIGRDIFVDTGGATLYSSQYAVITLSGVISGSGTLSNVGFGGTLLTLTGNNTFTGPTVTRLANVFTTLSGNGVLNASSSYDLMGTFTLTNTGTNNTNRLSDTAPVTLRGINFVDTGNATATSSETIGAVTGANGFNTFLVTPGTSAANSLTMASLARQNNATFDFRGTGLGGTPANTVSNIYITSAPTLSGGGGTATSLGIIPYAVGNTGTTATFTAIGQVGTSFVTYGTNGVRPLATTEYATAFGTAADNVRLTSASATVSASVTANALLYAPAATATLSGAGTINLTSGAFLYSPTVDSTGTVTAPINFGTAEGIVTATSALNLNGNLSGSNGLTITTAFAPSNNYTPNFAINGASTYTGNTTINAGAVTFGGTIDNGVAGPFGTSGTIILNAGRILASLVPGFTTTFNRDISSIGYGGNYISPSTSGFTSTFNGNISLSNNLYIEGYANAAANALIFNGTISGPGSLLDAGYTYGVFSGNNTYSGGTVLNGGTSSAATFYAGSDTAFGTGTISFNGTSVLAGSGTAARTLANNLLFNATTCYIGGAAPLTFTGGVSLNGSRTLSINNTALTTFSGVVANGALTKGAGTLTGTGTLVLGSATGNTYTGGTVVSTGTLLVTNTSGSGTGTGSVGVASGGTLGGTGFIVNTVPTGSTATTTNIASGGILQGGIGNTGALTLTGNLTLATGSIIQLGLADGGTHSTLTRGGGIWTFATNQAFSFNPGASAGFYDNIITGLAADPGGESSWTFTTSGYAGTFTYDGLGNIDLNLTASPVPEPATVLGGLLTTGLLGWKFRRRVRRFVARS